MVETRVTDKMHLHLETLQHSTTAPFLTTGLESIAQRTQLYTHGLHWAQCWGFFDTSRHKDSYVKNSELGHFSSEVIRYLKGKSLLNTGKYEFWYLFQVKDVPMSLNTPFNVHVVPWHIKCKLVFVDQGCSLDVPLSILQFMYETGNYFMITK